MGTKEPVDLNKLFNEIIESDVASIGVFRNGSGGFVAVVNSTCTYTDS